MGYSLGDAVGLNDDGSFCTNAVQDQQQVAELLLSIPLLYGGLRTSTGPAVTLPSPTQDGVVSSELVGAIQTFQTIQSANLNIDLRVEPDSPTFNLMVELATTPPAANDDSVYIVLDPSASTLEEAPALPVSGLPSLVYTPASTEELAIYDVGNLRVTITCSGTISGSWGTSIGPACVASPDINTLEQAVRSGDARNIGLTALNQACNELRAQTRVAANGLFSSVSVTWDGAGSFRISGSAGDKWRQVSLGYEFPDTLVATGSITIAEPVELPDLGSAVTFSGTMAMTIRVTIRNSGATDAASLTANLAVILGVAGIVLAPAAAWIAEAVTIAAARTLVSSSAAGLAGEWVLLGPSPQP